VKRALVALAAAAVSVLALSTAGAPAALNKCIPDKQAGIQIVNHVAVIVYCGHAKATVKSGNDTATQTTTVWTKGSCLKTAGNLILGFGKFTSIREPVPFFNAFYLVVPATQDGVFRLSVLQVQRKGKSTTVANNVRVVVKGQLSKGTFSGKFQTGRKFTGVFTCK
jgi:hypothetical protein